jgi:PBSX family phage terminase large subunit
MAADLSALVKALSPKQIRSVVDSTARINLWSGAIRSGKTVASLLRWLIFLAGDECPKRGQLVMVGQTRDTIARNIFAVLQDPGVFGDLTKEIHYTPGAPTAKIMGKTVHIIGAYDAKAEKRLRGLTCAAAYVDEATLVPEDFWTQLLGRMSVKGAKVFATTNPDNPAHWLRKGFILRVGHPGIDVAYWHFTLDDNPSLDPAYVAAIKAEFTGIWYRRWILGHWVAAEGAIYDMWDEDLHVVPDEQIPAIQRWIAAGIDYGTTNPFAAVMIGLGIDGVLYVVSELYYSSKLARRSKTDAEYSQDLQYWLENHRWPAAGSVKGVRPEYVCVDPSAASFVVQLHRDRITPTPARNSVVDGIRTVATLFALGRLKVAASCTNLIAEIPGYSWDDEKALKGVDEPIKVEDHACDGLRYALYTTESVWRPALRLEPVSGR